MCQQATKNININQMGNSQHATKHLCQKNLQTHTHTEFYFLFKIKGMCFPFIYK